MQIDKVKDYYGLDIVKWIMAICVVAIHTHPLENIMISREVQAIYQLIVGSAVPFFFIVNGFLMGVKSNDLNDLDYHLTRFGKKMIRLYIIWSFIYFPLAIYSFCVNKEGIFKSILMYIRNILFRGENYYSWPLWYMLSAIYAFIMIKSILRWKESEYVLGIVGIFAYVVSTLMEKFTLFQNLGWGGVEFAIKLFGDGRLFVGTYWIIIGILISKHTVVSSVKTQKFLYFFLLIVMISIETRINKLFFPICLFLFASSLELKKKEIFYIMRRSSKIIYLTHMLFFFLWSMRYGFQDNFGFGAFIFTITCSLILSVIVMHLDNRKNSLDVDYKQ